MIDCHGQVARIVITMRGSTPRTVGTEMFVWDNGQDSTIGGGALEYQVTNAAEQALKEQRMGAYLSAWAKFGTVLWGFRGFYARFLITRHYRRRQQMCETPCA